MPTEEVALDRCRGFGMCPSGLTSSDHPFPRAAELILSGDSDGALQVLGDYYSGWRPRSAAEVLGLPLRSRFARLPPLAALLPWLAISPEAYARAVASGSYGYYAQRGLTDWTTEDDGHTQWGPVSERKLALEYERLESLVQSLQEGWDDAHPTIIGSLLEDDRDGRWAVDIRDGLHRVAVLHVLGWEVIPVQYGDPVQRSQASTWTQVTAGNTTLKQALRIFDSFLEGR